MLPSQRKKVDISSMTEEEQKLFRLYGKLPSHKNVLTKITKDRKYFDSGDYALSKAGVAPQANVGTAIPSPDNIPHASTPSTPSHNQPSLSPSSSQISPTTIPVVIPVAGTVNGADSGSPPNVSSPIRESIVAE